MTALTSDQLARMVANAVCHLEHGALYGLQYYCMGWNRWAATSLSQAVEHAFADLPVSFLPDAQRAEAEELVAAASLAKASPEPASVAALASKFAAFCDTLAGLMGVAILRIDPAHRAALDAAPVPGDTRNSRTEA